MDNENSPASDLPVEATVTNLDAMPMTEKDTNRFLDNGSKADIILIGDTDDSSPIEKTELEREMELFEAAEKEDEARIFSSFRPDQNEEMSPQGSNPAPTEDTQGDRKRTIEAPLPERRTKRGRKAQAQQVPKEEEDVCFVCFDGGKLILCDRRACPKAYHVECTGRDTEFFNKRGAWFCGWHFCGICSKSATAQCYTCPNAFCNDCTKEADFLVIRKNRGLCDSCFPIVKMIEFNENVNVDGVEVDFEDKETYECLYKEYWEDLKQKLSLTWEDLDKALKAREAGDLSFANDQVAEINGNDREDGHSSEDNNESSSDADGVPKIKTRRYSKRKRLIRSSFTEDDSESDYTGDGDEYDESEPKSKRGHTRGREFDGWASKELLDFIQFSKEDPKKPLSRSAVSKLLWSYIESKKLQNQRKRSQIICDERLQKLFGKKTVGRFEIMKLLSSHIAPKQVNAAKFQDNYIEVDDEIAVLDLNNDRTAKATTEKQRKTRKKLDEKKVVKADRNEFAAVNIQNISLIYLRRALLEDLLDDPEFNSKVVGAFVRIRVPSMANKSEMCYRLVQVLGVKFPTHQEHTERKMVDVVLEILNLQKQEEVTVDLVSNQDFTEEECLRLRQSVKCGFIKAMTVGELEEKAISLQEVKVKDWFETELLRLSHLRDRASEKGRKRELRECVEKLQLLSSPQEKERRMKAPLEITVDPHMDPAYESDNEEVAHDNLGRAGDVHSLWDKSTEMEFPNWSQKDFVKDTEVDHFNDKKSYGWNQASNEREPERARGNGPGKGIDRNAGWNTNSGLARKDSSGEQGQEKGGDTYRRNGWPGSNRVEAHTGTSVFEMNSTDWRGRREQMSGTSTSPLSSVGLAAGGNSSQAQIDEKEKIWHYQDPTGTIQGPFSMEQLRKWEKTKLFPLDLQIWRTTERQDESILLTDALVGKFSKNVALSSIQPKAVEDAPHTGWGSAPTGWNSRGLSNRPGSDMQETSSRSGWDEDEFAQKSTWDGSKDGAAAWGAGGGWAYDKVQTSFGKSAEDDGWGLPQGSTDGAWGSQLPAESSKAADDGWGPGQERKSGGWDRTGLTTETGFHAKVSFRPNWGREFHSRDSDQNRNEKSGNEARNFKRKDIPCKFHQRGGCRKGPDCEFRH